MRKTKSKYRSGLEESIALQLKVLKIKATYESHIIKFIQPAKSRTYTPDFILPNGIVIESKGRFTLADRQKHLFIKEQHPDIDIRFVFCNSRSKINKNSKTTYASWCIANGFLYADKLIPEEWLDE